MLGDWFDRVAKDLGSEIIALSCGLWFHGRSAGEAMNRFSSPSHFRVHFVRASPLYGRYLTCANAAGKLPVCGAINRLCAEIDEVTKT